MGYKNKEGYPDPTEGEAIRRADKPPREYFIAIRLIRFTADCLGFEVTEKIKMKDKVTGRVWP